MLILPSVHAAIDFNIQPTTQTASPGDTVTVTLDVTNDEPFWGFSVKVNENPTDMTINQITESTRLDNGFNGNIQETDYTTLYSIFASNTPGITAGTGTLYTLQYDIPPSAEPGTIQLTPTELTVSDQNGGNLAATINGASITVQDEGSEEPVTGFVLPMDVTGSIDTTVDVPLCIQNTDTAAVENIDVTFTHDSDIAYVAQVIFNEGNGQATTEEGSTALTIDNLNIMNADCEDETGVNVATIRYYLQSIGTSPLTITSANANDASNEPFSAQALNNQNGQIGVNVNQATKSCQASPGVVTLNSATTITYKVTNPFAGTNIGGVDELDTFDSGATGFTQGAITNLAGGASNIVSSNPAAGQLRTVVTTSTQPLFSGLGTFDVYSVVFSTSGTTTLGNHDFNITSPPPPALEISDDQHQDLSATVQSCSVTVISACTVDADCDDNNVCNGQETCSVGIGCLAGSPLDCDDGNPNTLDTCHPVQGCQNTRIGGGGGGGGGGGSRYEEVDLCFSCGERLGTDSEWTCCGTNFNQIDGFCENPEVYSNAANGNYCSKPVEQEIIPITPPQRSTPEPISGGDTIPAKEPAPEPPVIPPQRSTPTEEPTEQEDGLGNLLLWILAILILGVLGAAIVYTIRHRRPPLTKPEPPTQPTEPRPAVPAPSRPGPQPTPAPKQPTPPEPSKPIIPPFLKPKPKKPAEPTTDFSELDKYAANIRKRLAKQTKKGKKK